MHRTASPAAAAAARTRLYALLCLATAPPEPWQRGWLHGHLAPLAFRIGSRLPFAGFRGGLLRLRRHLGRTSDRELAVQHAQLDRWAPPYESHYLDPEGMLMGAAAWAVEAAYREAGLFPDANWNDLPDNLRTELEFMTHLATREAVCWRAGNIPLAQQCLALEEQFLRKHLSRWIPAYAERVRQAEPSGFYGGVAGLIQQAVDLDGQWVAHLCSVEPALREG